MELLSFISIDTETTGLDFEKDRVIQFGATIFINGEEKHRESFYIANTDVPNGGFEVNQITDEQIQNGVYPGEAFALIACILEKRFHAKWNPRIVIYNAPFDLSFLANEFLRHDIPFNFEPIQILDPLVMWRNFKPYTPGRLDYVANALRVPVVGMAHDAGTDSATAGHVYLALRARYPILHQPYITNLQKGWNEKWQIGMRSYLTSQGHDPKFEPWPVRAEWASYRRDGQLELL